MWIIGQVYYKLVLMINYLMDHWSGLLQTSSHEQFIRYLMDHWSGLLQSYSHDQIPDGSLVSFITIISHDQISDGSVVSFITH